MMRLNEFKELNAAKGFHWFKPDTLRFFKSRITHFDCIAGLFISSERGPDDVRRYTVRQADFETGQVHTVGEFGQYNSIATAKTGLKRARLLTKEERISK
jgi:hypothetical protein